MPVLAVSDLLQVEERDSLSQQNPPAMSDRLIKNIGNWQSHTSSDSFSSDDWSTRHSRSQRAPKIKQRARGLYANSRRRHRWQAQFIRRPTDPCRRQIVMATHEATPRMQTASKVRRYCQYHRCAPAPQAHELRLVSNFVAALPQRWCRDYHDMDYHDDFSSAWA